MSTQTKTRRWSPAKFTAAMRHANLNTRSLHSLLQADTHLTLPHLSTCYTRWHSAAKGPKSTPEARAIHKHLKVRWPGLYE